MQATTVRSTEDTRTPEERAAYREKLRGIQISTTVRSSEERALSRVTNMPRAEFERMKQFANDTPSLGG